MADHRPKHGDRRPAPVPRRLPVAPEVPAVVAARRSGPARLLRAPKRWSRRTGRWLRTKQGRWSLIVLACVVIVLIGLLGQGFLHSPAPAPSVSGIAAGPQGGQGGLPSITDTASPSRTPKPSGTSTRLTSDPVQALRDAFPDNPLNHLRSAGLHDLVLNVSSAGSIAVLGYLVPTGLGAPYGSVKTHASHWTNRQQAIGKGYLAAIFVQTGRSGTPITCSISVDGKVTNTETTSGAYGRAVCLG